MKLPGTMPSPCPMKINPTSAAIAARTKRVPSAREEPVDATGVGCTANEVNAPDRRP
jgi:hypothetical protein